MRRLLPLVDELCAALGLPVADMCGVVAGAVQKVKQASGLINGGQDSRGAAGVRPVGAVGAGDDRCHEASQYETVVARVAACRLQYSGVGQHLSVFSCVISMNRCACVPQLCSESLRSLQLGSVTFVYALQPSRTSNTRCSCCRAAVFMCTLRSPWQVAYRVAWAP